MEYKEIRAVLHQHFFQMLENQKAKIDTYGRLDATDKTALLTTVELAKQSLEHDEDFCDFEEGYEQEVLTSLIKKYNMHIELDGKDYQTLRTEFKIAYRDYCQQLLDHDQSFDSYAYSKALPLSAIIPEPAKAIIKLSDAIERYIQNGTGQRGWTDRTAKGYRSELNLILDFIGDDTSLHLTKQQTEAIQQMLCQIPKNPRGAKYKDLSIEELMELGEEDNPRMDIKTVKKYLSRYGSFYEWAGRHYEDLGRNYFIDLQKDIRATDDAVRDPFTPEQIKAMLDVVLNENILDHQKWGTLIALYTGARRNEIAQLELDDIREIDGVLCFDINDQSKHNNRKSLKTSGSKRIIPVHSKLLEYGLTDYAGRIRQSGRTRLFPNLNYDKNEGGYGRAIGRWMNETLLPQLGMKSKSLVFHSFRHTMSAKLRNAGVSEAMADSIIGGLTTNERSSLNEVLKACNLVYDDKIGLPNIEDLADLVMSHHLNTNLPKFGELENKFRQLIRENILDVANPDLANHVLFFEKLKGMTYGQPSTVWIWTPQATKTRQRVLKLKNGTIDTESVCVEHKGETDNRSFLRLSGYCNDLAEWQRFPPSPPFPPPRSLKRVERYRPCLSLGPHRPVFFELHSRIRNTPCLNSFSAKNMSPAMPRTPA